jgi:glycine cleavage system H protein
MKYFAVSGEWAEVGPSGWKVGLSRESAANLGDVTFLELPAVGQAVTPDGPAAVLEAVKAAADFHSPVTGIVLEVNQAVVADPSLVSSSPEDEGWLFTVKLEGFVPPPGLVDEAVWRHQGSSL